jgi:hypothetical protein
MSYAAILAPITEVRAHPNSDNGLKLVTIAGHQVITNNPDVAIGALFVFFPEGGQLSKEFLYENSEYRISSSGPVGKNKDPKSSGFFEANGRVRTIKLRGEISEGYMVAPSNLRYTGWDLSSLPSGTTFTELNGHKICQKYVNDATQRRLNANSNPGQKRRKTIAMFHEHYDTQNLRYNIHRLRPGMKVEFTEKLHGVSGRTGHFQVPHTLREEIANDHWFAKGLVTGLATIAGFFLRTNILDNERLSWETVTGTRRVVLENGNGGPRGYYSGTDFRQKIHDSLRDRLHKGETLYYEIVGFDKPGSALFSHHITPDNVGSGIIKKYKDHLFGGSMVYSYGCDRELGTCEVYVYRITMTNEDGTSIEYSREQIEARCELLGLKVVPFLAEGYLYEDEAFGTLMFHNIRTQESMAFSEACKLLSQGTSTLDKRHIREGVCARVTSKDLQNVFKYKGFEFCHLEGIAKNDDSVVDIEEAS